MKGTIPNKYFRIGLFMNSTFVLGCMYKLFFPNPPTPKLIIVIWVGFGVVALGLIIKGYLEYQSKEKQGGN